MSKNRVTVEHLTLACRHVRELMNAGVSENLSIRTLELFCDVYAKIYKGGTATPHNVRQVPLTHWSNLALEALLKDPALKPQGKLIVEHGTPRREFARLVLKLFDDGKLNQKNLNTLVRKKWKLAVVTVEEDKKLGRRLRSTALSRPESRWELVGIEFGDSSLIHRLVEVISQKL